MCVRIAVSGVRAHTISLLHKITLRVCGGCICECVYSGETQSEIRNCVGVRCSVVYGNVVLALNSQQRIFFIQAYSVVDKGSLY